MKDDSKRKNEVEALFAEVEIFEFGVMSIGIRDVGFELLKQNF